MSALPPLQQFNVGSDGSSVVISITDAAGNVVSAEWTIETAFDSRQRTAQLESIAINGVPVFRDLEEGWEGTLGFDRGSSFLDDFIAAKEAARYDGQSPPSISIYQTISDPNGGSPSAYQFLGVTVREEDAGRYTGNAKVEQRLAWRASYRIKAQ
jgi:hypothetical protein